MKTTLLVTPAVARIHAHICGDGCVYLAKKKRSQRSLMKHPRKNLTEDVWIIEYVNTCDELLKEFECDLKSKFNRKAQWHKNGLSVKVVSIKWILELLLLQQKGTYTWFIPDFILLASTPVVEAWLRAFFDDEGTVAKTGPVRVKSMNKKGLQQVKQLLGRLDIDCSITGPNCDNSYYLHIYKRFVPRYHERIGFLHPAKKKRLDKIIEKMGPRGLSA